MLIKLLEELGRSEYNALEKKLEDMSKKDILILFKSITAYLKSDQNTTGKKNLLLTNITEINRPRIEDSDLEYPEIDLSLNTELVKDYSIEESEIEDSKIEETFLESSEESIENEIEREKETLSIDSLKEIEEESAGELSIYCDGACKGNPGLSGSGVIVYDGADIMRYYGDFDEKGTNNSAELKAIIKALELANSSETAIIYSDSKYCINTLTKWAKGWKEKGWTKKSGEIKNLDLIKKAYDLYEAIEYKVEIQHVKAHSGIEGNEEADRLAGLATKEKNKEFKIE